MIRPVQLADVEAVREQLADVELRALGGSFSMKLAARELRMVAVVLEARLAADRRARGLT